MSIGCLERIQTFLLSESHEDQRHFWVLSLEDQNGSIELHDMSLENIAVVANQLFVRPSSTAPIALHDVDFRVAKGSLTMLLGVVGSGKSTLLKAIIGELKCESGDLQVSSKNIAYCSQNAWLQNATIRQIICGISGEVSPDQEWYTTVKHACALDYDVLQLPDVDDMLIGSRGVTLSGGQKQRLVSTLATNKF